MSELSLVTGGAGFIGSHIVAALLARGDRVRVLDDFSSGREENLRDMQGDLEVVRGDVRHWPTVVAAMRGVRRVFHQAAFVSVPLSLEDPFTCFEINLRGTLNVLEAARRAGVRNVVLASSAAVYGEADAIPLHEDLPAAPLSPYASSKRADEVYAAEYNARGLRVVALRYFNVYGPRQRPDSPYAAVVPLFADRFRRGLPPVIFGDGGQTRDLIYVGDVARANLLAADWDGQGPFVFNVCTGRQTSLLDLVAAMRRVSGRDLQPTFAPPRPGDIYRSVGRPDRARQSLGFVARTSLDEGLRAVWQWVNA